MKTAIKQDRNKSAFRRLINIRFTYARNRYVRNLNTSFIFLIGDFRDGTPPKRTSFLDTSGVFAVVVRYGICGRAFR